MTNCKKCIYFGTSDCKAENCPPDEKKLRKATFQEVMKLMDREKRK